tara:strand:- start:927 stop:1193 length:267 start_codon:yes stop_codon:yes gene_type:complete
VLIKKYKINRATEDTYMAAVGGPNWLGSPQTPAPVRIHTIENLNWKAQVDRRNQTIGNAELLERNKIMFGICKKHEIPPEKMTFRFTI